jgi:anti-sigma regulatory factor (Ser/Thr protein kinase)
MAVTSFSGLFAILKKITDSRQSLPIILGLSNGEGKRIQSPPGSLSMHWYSDDPKAEAAMMQLGTVADARRVQIHRPDEMAPTLQHLEDWMCRLGYPRRDIFAVRVVLMQAVANAVRHGNGNDPAKHVDVVYLVSPDEVLAEVQDQGSGFDPDQALNPMTLENRERRCGRGVFLMRIYSTWVSFSKPGNRVILCRRRTGPR